MEVGATREREPGGAGTASSLESRLLSFLRFPYALE